MKTFYQSKLEKYYNSRANLYSARLAYENYISQIRWLWPWENQTKLVKSFTPKEKYEVPPTRMDKKYLRKTEEPKIKFLKSNLKACQKAFTKAENELKACIQSHL